MVEDTDKCVGNMIHFDKSYNKGCWGAVGGQTFLPMFGMCVCIGVGMLKVGFSKALEA